jgi:hypothetical protein
MSTADSHFFALFLRFGFCAGSPARGSPQSRITLSASCDMGRDPTNRQAMPVASL